MLRIDERRAVGDVIVLDLKGTICAGVPENDLGKRVRALVLRGYRKVLLNLADASSADASGISALLGALLDLRDVGGQLKLVHLSGRTKEMLIVVALHGYFSVFDSEEEALASFDSSQARLVA